MYCVPTKKLVLQWHITAKCNQRCKHCYQERYEGEELTFNEITEVMNQYKELLRLYSKNKNKDLIKGHINVTGGEPFTRKDFFQILNEFSKNKDYFSFAILTNGSYITEDTAKTLKELNTAFVQVSIDGSRKTHDALRGKENFDQTWNAVRILRKHNIRILVSFTAHKGNYKEFPIVARYARKYKASKLWTDRLVPMGSGEEMKDMLFTPEEALEYYSIINKEKKKSFRNNLAHLEISSDRALQFLKSAGTPYSCSAGDSLITILENGEVVPCRRMPIPCGENSLITPLKDIYFGNEVFKDLRNKNIPDKCSKCVYSEKCRGGLKCLSYALYKDYKQADNCCPIIYK